MTDEGRRRRKAEPKAGAGEVWRAAEESDGSHGTGLVGASGGTAPRGRRAPLKRAQELPRLAQPSQCRNACCCTSASGLITPGKIYFPWEGATKRSWVLLTETPASPASQKSRFALEQAVRLLFLQAAGCWFSSLLTHRSLQPQSRFSCERRCPGRSQKVHVSHAVC